MSGAGSGLTRGQWTDAFNRVVPRDGNCADAASVRFHLHDDFASRAALAQMDEGRVRLVEREYPVDDGPDPTGFE